MTYDFGVQCIFYAIAPWLFRSILYACGVGEVTLHDNLLSIVIGMRGKRPRCCASNNPDFLMLISSSERGRQETKQQ